MHTQTRPPGKSLERSPAHISAPMNHQHEIKRVNRIRGQVEAIQRMILEERYCPEILLQIKAAHAALKSLERSILETHLHGCVESAISSRDPREIREKIDELVNLLKNH